MDSMIVTLLTGTGGAVAALGAIVILFVLGLICPRSVVTDLKAENAELKQALKEERSARAASVTAAETTKDILAAIRLGRDIGHERGSP
jgi:hypothetical protein